jgi:casein kinase 1
MFLKSSTQKTQQQTLKDYEIPIGDSDKLDARKKLGRGAFGDIYLGKNIKQIEEVAIKLEPIKTKHPQLFYESKLYMALQSGIGIPKIHWCGSQGNYNILIMDLLGPSLENILIKNKNNIPLKKVINYGLQMIDRIEYIHQRHIIHRDIKPENFLIKKNKDNKEILYLIDFGLAKRFRDPKTGLHISYKDGKSLTGTARFASIYTHLGIEQSRRDDLEGMMYTLLYLIKGKLPWQGLKAKSKEEKCQKIMEKKIDIPIEKLCKGLHKNFGIILHYCRSLLFDEKPNYDFIRNKLKEIINENKLNDNELFVTCDKEITPETSNNNNVSTTLEKRSDEYQKGDCKILDLKAQLDNIKL